MGDRFRRVKRFVSSVPCSPSRAAGCPFRSVPLRSVSEGCSGCAYLGAVREYGYRHGIGGLSSMLEFTEFSQLDSAQLAYEDGYREGDSVRMQALTHHLSS